MGFEERNHKFKIINLKLYMANILITGANGQLGTELRNRSFSLMTCFTRMLKNWI